MTVACDTQTAWFQFLEFVKERSSATAFNNWLAPIQVLETDEERCLLEIPNIFVQEYLLSNYKKELVSFFPTRENGEPALDFVIRTPKKEPFTPAPSLNQATRKVQEEKFNEVK